MDKAYTMMYGLDRSGIVATISPIFDLSSHKTLTKSLQLPLPNKKSLIKQGIDNITEALLNISHKYEKIILGEITLEQWEVKKSKSLKDAFNWIKQKSISGSEKDRLTYLQVMHEMIETINSIPNPTITQSNLSSGLVQLLNKHNNYNVTAEGLKNRVMNTIWHCATDIKNLEASSQPMDSKSIKDLIEEIEEERGTPKKIYNNINPFTKYSIQYENSVGKKNVGIAANGVKGAAAIQQYFNTYYQAWNGIDEIDPNYRLDLTLRFTERKGEDSYREIYSDNIFIVGDVVISEQQFKKLSEGKDFTQTTDYQAIITYLTKDNLPVGDIIENIGAEKRITNYYKPIKNADDSPELKSQYSDLISSWNLYIQEKLKKGITITNNNLNDYWTDFLYYKRQFNANVADMISIFISLATDNAKELVLARINATPELMSMPIAMLTLGIPPKQVLDICITCLDPIAKQLRRNRLQNPEYVNVRQLIENDTINFDENTRQSLLKVYDAAQEMRAITSFFKINQGLTAQYVELLNFYKNLAAVLPQMIARKNGIKIANVEEPAMNLEKLFSQKWKGTTERDEYVEHLKALMDQNKSAFNVINIVLKNTNFSAMLEAMQAQLESIQFASGAASFVNIRSIIASESENQLKTNDYKVLLRLYQDFIIGKTLQSDDFADIKFSLETIAKSFGINQNEIQLPHKTNAQFGLNTEIGVENFIYIVEQIIIPKLQEKYKDNFFIRSLEEYYNRQLDKNSYQLMYDVFDDEDVAEQQNIQNAIQDLKRIEYHHSGLETIFGQSLTIGDIFYLYDTIVYKQRMSGLDMVVKSVANQRNSKFADNINKMYIYYDELSRKNPEQARSEYEQLDLIQKAVLNGGSASDNATNITIDVKGKYIWTFAEPAKNNNSLKEIIQNYTSQGVIDRVSIIKQNAESALVQVNIYLKGLPYHLTENINTNNVKGLFQEQVKLESLIIDRSKLETIKTRLEFYKHEQDREKIWITKDLDFFTKKLVKQDELELKKILEGLYNGQIKPILKTPSNIFSSILDAPVQGYVQYDNNIAQSIVIPETASIYELLDLLLEIKVKSKDRKVKFSYLQKLLETTSEAKKIKNDYFSYLSTVYPEKEIVQKCADIQEFTGLYLSNKEYFYRKPLPAEITAKRIEPGDIVIFTGQKLISFKDEYVYVGIVQGSYTFVGATNGKIRTIPANEDGDNNIPGMTIKSKLRVPCGYYPTEPVFISSNVTLTKETGTVQEGDKITLSDNSNYTVCYVIYDPKEDGSYDESYLIYNPEEGFGIVHNTHIKQIEKHQNNISVALGHKNVYAINSNFETGSNILKQLRKGDSIYIQDSDGIKSYLFEAYIDSTTVKAGGKYWNIKDIIAVESYAQKHSDPTFEHDTRPVEVFMTSPNLAQYLYFHRGWKPININNRGKQSGLIYQFNVKEKEVTQFTLNDQLVYNLQDYAKVKQSALQKDDIFINYQDGKASQFIKILNIKDGIYEILLKEDGVYTLDYVPYTQIEETIKGWDHYSKSILPDIKQEVSSIEISGRQQGNNILDYLQKQVGLELVFGDIDHAAQIEGNYLIINQKFKNSPESIVDEALHEFTHIAIAMLRIKDPDTYVSMISHFQNTIEPSVTGELKQIFENIDSDNTHYLSLADKLEEKIVKFLDYYRNDNKYNIVSDKDLKTFINDGFSALFGSNLSGIPDMSKESVKWALKKYDNGSLFNEISTGINMLELAKREKRKHMLNRIIEKCY